ncbi:PREDICTED: uncharacterized protein LOC106816202 [Priapulus caudatus]|uniref:Uncharacterized protein LOC106816202 n=1 Tax=Priapulus caudatus TaxID=37621 RepID=A0ABM1EVN0_PRICU|nr:PREDICTED: uncharacterized protein LOC106816202 [Priapulus caudatus]
MISQCFGLADNGGSPPIPTDYIASCSNDDAYTAPSNVHKIAIMGSSMVGKTDICNRLLGAPLSSYKPTLQDTVTVPVRRGRSSRNYEITDLGDPCEFPPIYRLNILRCSSFLLVYSPAKPDSYEVVCDIVEDIRELKESLDGCNIVIVCNRYLGDEPENDVVVGGLSGCDLVHASAVNNENIDTIWNILIVRHRRHKHRAAAARVIED